MAEIFNEQRVLGVVLVDEGATIYNNLPVIGVSDAGDVLFSDNLRTLGVDVLDQETVGIHNEQPVRGAVKIEDGRKIYNNSLVIPVSGLPDDFDPASLFTNSEQGGLYDPSDLTTLFQDAAGTTPVTTDGDPVGLVLDKRLWGGKTLEQVLAGQTDKVVDPSFDDASKWTLSNAIVSDGALTFTAASTGSARNSAGNPAVVGSKYRTTIVVDEISGGSIRAEMGGSPGSPLVSISAPGTYTIAQTAADLRSPQITVNSGTVTAVISHFSTKLIPGNHLTQPTVSARPTYKTDGTLHWLEGDGVDDFLRSSFTITQPWDRVSAIQQITWVTNSRVFDGASSDSRLYQRPATPQLSLYAGGTLLAIGEMGLGVNGVVTERFNGATSRAAINNGAYKTGSVGTAAAGGITVFSSYVNSSYASARCYGLIMREGEMTDEQIVQTRQWMAKKTGVSW